MPSFNALQSIMDAEKAANDAKSALLKAYEETFGVSIFEPHQEVPSAWQRAFEASAKAWLEASEILRATPAPEIEVPKALPSLSELFFIIEEAKNAADFRSANWAFGALFQLWVENKAPVTLQYLAFQPDEFAEFVRGEYDEYDYYHDLVGFSWMGLSARIPATALSNESLALFIMFATVGERKNYQSTRRTRYNPIPQALVQGYHQAFPEFSAKAESHVFISTPIFIEIEEAGGGTEAINVSDVIARLRASVENQNEVGNE